MKNIIKTWLKDHQIELPDERIDILITMLKSEEREDIYTCENCKEEWEFCPEDYDYRKEIYPTICPFCDMPVTQMIKDVYKEEGLLEVLRMLWRRFI